MRNIILCGFMGCGKSTVGRVLAQMTGRTLVDTDTYIEAQASRSRRRKSASPKRAKIALTVMPACASM